VISADSHSDNSSTHSGPELVEVDRMNQVQSRERSGSVKSDQDSTSEKSEKEGVTAPNVTAQVQSAHIPGLHLITTRPCGWPVMPPPVQVPSVSPPIHLSQTNFNIQASEFVPRRNSTPILTNTVSQTPASLTPITTTTSNGRILTTLQVRLAPIQPAKTPRNTNKLDLTGKKCAKNIDALKVVEENKKAPTPQRYTRDYLLSLKDTKLSLMLPVNLPNIPELIPTSKQQPCVTYNLNKRNSNAFAKRR